MADPRVQQAREPWEHYADLDCVECPDCAFCFQDVHRDEDEGYSCPACSEFALTRRVADLESRLRQADEVIAAAEARATEAEQEVERLMWMEDERDEARAENERLAEVKGYALDPAFSDAFVGLRLRYAVAAAQEPPAEPDEFAGWDTCPICREIGTAACVQHKHLAEPPADGGDR